MRLHTFAGAKRCFTLVAVLLLVWFCGCKKSAPPAISIRLADSYKPELVEGRVHSISLPPRTEWRFDGSAPSPAPEKFVETRGWEAGTGIADLKIKDGRLAGRTTTDLPILHLERTAGLEDSDSLHSIEVRLRVSAGSNLTIAFDPSEKLDFNDDLLNYARDFWDIKTPIVAGDQIQTYTLRSPYSENSSRIRHILIRPTDASGTQFEIESVRLIFRKEYLAGVSSGVGWQGLSEIYHDTIVSRSPEKIRIPVRLSKHPWLDLALGTLENEPVTFRVSVSQGNSKQEDLLLEKTVTTPQRWESSPVDLRRFADQKVTVSLSLESNQKGAIGFWGSPVIRNAGMMSGSEASQRNSTRPQGVIVIWADTLRRDHLDVYGYDRPTAPHLRQMAANGLLFQDCVSQATWTKVATPSLMTSLYPTSHGVHDFYDRIPAAATTLAEVFQQAGYATLSMSSILFTGKFTNLHQGFDEVQEQLSLPDQRSSKTARVYVDRLLPWLETHREVPFFVFLHVSDPHDPYRPYPPYDTLWADASRIQEHERQTKEARKFISDPLLKLFGMPSGEELIKAGYDPKTYAAVDRDLYDGSIRAMDAEIGRLTERLRMLGLDRKTLVVFLGDHGEEFLEHGRLFHGQSVYGELTNVPLIMWGSGVAPGHGVIKETVETVDLMPTILEISKLPVPSGIQGRSFLPLFASSASGSHDAEASSSWSRPAITEKAATTSSVGAPPPHDTESYSIVLDGWKLIYNPRRAAGKAEYELYEERKDPLNQHDLAGLNPEVVKRLTKEFVAWQTKVKAERLKPDSESTKGLSQEELERLRSLGYIQ